ATSSARQMIRPRRCTRALYAGAAALTTRPSPRWWLASAFHVGDVEDAFRHLGVVADVAHLVGRMHGVRHGRDVALHGRRIATEPLVVAELHALDVPFLEFVDVYPRERREPSPEP